jgi:hypothetical protein
MEKILIIEKIEEGAHHFLHSMRIEYEGTREASLILEKYMKEGKITDDEEKVLKMQFVDSLKMAGVVLPFVLIPGASILMPILIKVAEKHNIELLPSAFNNKNVPNIIEDNTQASV